MNEGMSNQGRSVGRFTSLQKVDAVLRILKGESLDSVSEDVGVSIRRLTRWQNEFVAGGAAELSRRRSSTSHSWLKKQSGAIVRWTFLLLVLGASIALLALMLQRGV
jgi:hypothetical protein